eukprot:6183144-Pleurochrysis_carterae.AAC.1
MAWLHAHGSAHRARTIPARQPMSIQSEFKTPVRPKLYSSLSYHHALVSARACCLPGQQLAKAAVRKGQRWPPSWW